MENKTEGSSVVIGYRLKSHFKTDGSLDISSSNMRLKAGVLYGGDTIECKEIQRLLAQPGSWIEKYVSPVYQKREIAVKG